MLPLAFEFDPALAGRLELGALALDVQAIEPERSAFERRTESLLEQLRSELIEDDRARARWLAPARNLYRAFGIDPTRRRPSSEALLRRVLKGFDLPRVHPLVDAVNVCQLEQALPYGLYDRARIDPPVCARVGQAGEGYPGIRKGWIGLEGKPVLADRQGPFGNPSADSLRTAVGDATRSLLLAVFAPAGTGRVRLERVLDDTKALFELIARVEEGGRAIFGAQPETRS